MVRRPLGTAKLAQMLAEGRGSIVTYNEISNGDNVFKSVSSGDPCRQTIISQQPGLQQP
jgi:hypothetical protein